MPSNGCSSPSSFGCAKNISAIKIDPRVRARECAPRAACREEEGQRDSGCDGDFERVNAVHLRGSIFNADVFLARIYF